MKRYINFKSSYGVETVDELWDFICKWDSQFKVTGEPIRFCLNGKIKTDW